MVTELKILQANTSKLFKVLMGHEKKNEPLKLYIGMRRKKDHRNCKSARGFRATRKRLDNVPM